MKKELRVGHEQKLREGHEHQQQQQDMIDTQTFIQQRQGRSNNIYKDFLMDQGRLTGAVRKYCAANNLTRPLNLYLYSHDSKRNFLFCRHHKVATSTMMKTLTMNLEGFANIYKLSGVPEESINEDVEKMKKSISFYPQSIYTWTVNYFSVGSKKKIEELSKTSLLYSIVRHPYERIVSAYENRIMDPKIDLGHEFREKYGEPSFPKFVDMILEEANGCNVDRCQSMNEHWRPFYASCSYCDLNYHFITKLENIERDIPIIFNNILNVHLKKVVQVNSGDSREDEKKMKTLTFLRLLEKTKRDMLYEVYHHDFKMFEYDAYLLDK